VVIVYTTHRLHEERFLRARRLHRPTRVGSIASPRSSLHLGPLFCEVCSEAADLQRCGHRCAGADRLRAGGLSNFSVLAFPRNDFGVATEACYRSLQLAPRGCSIVEHGRVACPPRRHLRNAENIENYPLSLGPSDHRRNPTEIRNYAPPPDFGFCPLFGDPTQTGFAGNTPNCLTVNKMPCSWIRFDSLIILNLVGHVIRIISKET
jgi:hypothetical protein